jgi:hypothetical protein
MYKAVSFGLLLLPLLALSPGCAKKGDVAVPNGDQLGTRYGGGSEKSSDTRGRGGEGASSPSGGAFEPAPTAPRDDAGRWEAEADFGADAIAREESRPGLGTAYGEDRRSSVETVGFRRAEPTTPDVVFSIRYDDVGGVRAAGLVIYGRNLWLIRQRRNVAAV